LDTSPTRREFLSAGAATAALGAAGCLDAVGLGDEGIDADGYAAFFPLWDFAEHVGGEEMSFSEPVETGRMGHGWNPDATLVPEVASTEVFVYLDTPEFSWAQDVARALERDHPDVAIIDLFDGMAASTGADDHDRGGDDHDESGHEGNDHDHEEDGHEDQSGHDHPGRDPHVSRSTDRSRQS
jgi:zinc transport system substrate-binding protein